MLLHKLSYVYFFFPLFSCSNRMRNVTTALPAAEDEERQVQLSRLEESFTIHLGNYIRNSTIKAF